jgi:hypothetical protein
VNGMDRHLRDLLEAAVGEPPRQVSAAAVRSRVIRRRVVQYTAVTAAVIAVLVLVGLGTLGRALPHAPAPATRPHPETPIITSRHYGYTEALPAGWRLVTQAKQQWDGNGAPGDGDSVVDLYVGPGGVEAWVYAAPTKENLAAYAITTVRVAGAVHDCPAVPQTNQAITVGGAPGRLLDTQCPALTSFLVELAVTVHHGIGFVFGSQNPSGTAPGDWPADRAAFRDFLAGIRLQR